VLRRSDLICNAAQLVFKALKGATPSGQWLLNRGTGTPRRLRLPRFACLDGKNRNAVRSMASVGSALLMCGGLASCGAMNGMRGAASKISVSRSTCAPYWRLSRPGEYNFAIANDSRVEARVTLINLETGSLPIAGAVAQAQLTTVLPATTTFGGALLGARLAHTHLWSLFQCAGRDARSLELGPWGAPLSPSWAIGCLLTSV
jgi:hypothetical protein